MEGKMGIGYWVTRAVLSVKAPFRGNKQQNGDLNQASVKLFLSLSLLSQCHQIEK